MKRIRMKLQGARRSFTVWFNSVLGVLVVGLPDAQLAFPQLREYIPAEWYHYTMGVLIIGNILLRFKTRYPLEMK